MASTGRRSFGEFNGCSAAGVLLLLAVSGCAVFRPIQPSPWSYSQQHEAILEIAPLQTPRDEAVERLTKAGIQGSYGVSESIYYCDIWERPGGARWHVNLALYFDAEGKLYDIRPGQAETGEFAGTIAAAEKPEPPAVYGADAGRQRRNDE